MTPAIPVTMLPMPGLINIATELLQLSGGLMGSSVTDFVDRNTNILPPLRGPHKVGVVSLPVQSWGHHGLPHCDFGDHKAPDVFCEQPRELAVSMFYPACFPATDKQSKHVLLGEEHFAPVFEPPLVGSISQAILGDSTAMHNLMSQAITDAPVCGGHYAAAIFTPDAGGQRQAYTQVASELAALGHIALTVDHPYLSSAVGLSDGTIARSLFKHANKSEAILTQMCDVQTVVEVIAGDKFLDKFPSWNGQVKVDRGVCVFGHGSGGAVAHLMRNSSVITCAASLDHLLTLPVPFNAEKESTIELGPDAGQSAEGSSSSFLDDEILKQFPLPVKQKLLQMTRDRRETVMHALSGYFCPVTGTCANLESDVAQKRTVGSNAANEFEKGCEEGCGGHEDQGDKDYRYQKCSPKSLQPRKPSNPQKPCGDNQEQNAPGNNDDVKHYGDGDEKKRYQRNHCIECRHDHVTSDELPQGFHNYFVDWDKTHEHQLVYDRDQDGAGNDKNGIRDDEDGIQDDEGGIRDDEDGIRDDEDGLRDDENEE